MKKLLLLIFLFLFTVSFFGCTQSSTKLVSTNTTTTENSYDFSVMVPAGAPALAQVFMQDDSHYNVDVVNGPDPLVAAFTSGSYDFIFAPTNLGAKLYNMGIEYKFLAAITFGNYYLVSNQTSDFTIQSLEGKEITLFGQNATSDIILQYILNENDVHATLNYVDSVTSANSIYIADDTKIIMTAEPSLSILEDSVPGFKIIDLQEEYAKITGEGSYPQAGVFGKVSLTDDQINQFLDDLESSVIKVKEYPNQAIEKAIEFNYGFSETVLLSAIPNCHFDYINALNVRVDLETYFNIILNMNSALIGGTLPDDDFYYQS